ncbi:hypothetical protein PspLS_12075 [Pyricularia sp. CBS 133598]|nr:hypothetical protein PspLS_12075 [Pyricularia sp. CBS 133598]
MDQDVPSNEIHRQSSEKSLTSPPNNTPSHGDSVTVEPAQPVGWRLAALFIGLFLSLFLCGLVSRTNPSNLSLSYIRQPQKLMLRPKKDIVIMATAIPKITNEFASLNDIGWYGSAFFLTLCGFDLIFGKLYAIFSVKKTYLASIVAFLVGSAICGGAGTSKMLIVGRAIAGLGTAGILTGTFVMIGIVIPPPLRPMYTGIVGAVYGVASVIGPLLGGLFTDKLTWRWCFWINLPIGGLAIVVILLFLHAPPGAGFGPDAKTWFHRLHTLDPIGVILLLTSLALLLVALQWGGTVYSWTDPKVYMLLVTSVILAAAFVAAEIREGSNAVMPISIVTKRTVAAGAWLALCSGASDLVFRQYVPIWFQAIQGVSAVDAGVRSMAMILSTGLSSIAAGALTTATGYANPSMIIAAVMATVAAGLMATWSPATTPAQWIGYQVMYGIGSGQWMQSPIVAVQAVLDPAELPQGTALLVFQSAFGGAIFISVAQTLFVNIFSSGLAANLPQVNIKGVIDGGATSLRDPGVLPEGLLEPVLYFYNQGLTHSWYLGVALALAATVGVLAAEWKSVKKPDNEVKDDEKGIGGTDKSRETTIAAATV